MQQMEWTKPITGNARSLHLKMFRLICKRWLYSYTEYELIDVANLYENSYL